MEIEEIKVVYQIHHSPREESLQIAIDTRQAILKDQINAVAVLRACYVIAKNLNKKDDQTWINNELEGYYDNDPNFPAYRKASSRRINQHGQLHQEFGTTKVSNKAHQILSFARLKEGIRLTDESGKFHFTQFEIESILAGIVDRCLIFLCDIINELQYGGVVEYLMEEVRRTTDEKLAKLDDKLSDEARSMFENLTSTNPADWNKVGHSSRKMLLLLADIVFPPGDKYVLKNHKQIEVGSQNYINRLIAFLDQKASGEEEKLIRSEIEYLDCYLREMSATAQVVVHAQSIEKYRANMLAIHTYLIISEIMKKM